MTDISTAMTYAGPDRETDTTSTGDLPHRFAATLIVIYALLVLPSLFVLGGNLNWPDIVQGTAARDALPVIRAEIGTFRFGYLLLTLDALLFWPAAYCVLRALARGERLGPLLQLAQGFALASAGIRALWWAVGLTVYPRLDQLFLAAPAGSATREAIDVVYVAVNEIFSTVQEDIGVNILGALFTILVSVAILREGKMPRWFGVVGLLGGGLLVSSSAELLGIGTGEIIPLVAPTIVQLWFLAIGVAIWRRRDTAG